MGDWSRLTTVLCMTLGPALGLTSNAKAQCPTLTPSVLFNQLANGELAFAFDDEGLAQTPLYLDITSVAGNGSFTGTISTAAATPSSATYFSVDGSLSQANNTNGLAISFQYVEQGPPPSFTSYSYSGAIAFGSNCQLFIAGTFSGTSFTRVGQRPFYGLMLPVPFSGKVVLYVFK
jgi:hypothetical protein